MLPQQEPSPKNPDSDREVFRSAGSIVLTWAWLLIAVITLIDLAVQGRDHDALTTAAVIVAITAVVYGCAWRPCIIADSTGIMVANPLRDHLVPWAAVANVDVVHTVRVECTPAPGEAKGKILYSWAVQSSPSSARRAARRAGLTGQRPRLTRSRYSRTDAPPGAPAGYGQVPDPAREALDRTSAEFTAARLAERAQHARQARALKAQAEAAQQAAGGAAGAVAERPMADQPVTEQPVAEQPVAEQPVATWAWGAIAVMLLSIALLIIVAVV